MTPHAAGVLNSAVVYAAQARGVGRDEQAGLWLALARNVQEERNRLCGLIGQIMANDVLTGG